MGVAALLVVVLAAAGVLLWPLLLPALPPPPDTYLKDIQAKGVLRVGIDPTYAPFDTIKEGAVSGYDAELARELASAMGVRVEFVPMALDTLYDGLAAGKVDVLISALPFVYERQKDVRYSVPYYQSGQVLVVKADDTSIASVADLRNRRVAVELGSEADTEARRLARETVQGMQVLSRYHSTDEAFGAVLKGDADASVADNLSAEEYARSHPGSVKIVLPPLTDEPYVVAMPVKATSLADSINATIEHLRATGRLASIMGQAQ